jgi:hypothetical protein
LSFVLSNYVNNITTHIASENMCSNTFVVISFANAITRQNMYIYIYIYICIIYPFDFYRSTLQLQCQSTCGIDKYISQAMKCLELAISAFNCNVNCCWCSALVV